MSTSKTYEYEERAFIDEKDFIKIKEKLDEIALSHITDNKTSYFFVLPDKNVSIASSNSKTVVKYKGGQLGNGNGFEEHEFAIKPNSLSEAIKLFTSLFHIEPQISEQFRINYTLPNLIEVALKYTQTWGFHLEIERLYTIINEKDDSSEKLKAKNDVNSISIKLGIKNITDEEMKSFKKNCDAGNVRGPYSPNEFRQKYGSLFSIQVGYKVS